MKVIPNIFYAVQRSDGKYLGSKGYGREWVDDIRLLAMYDTGQFEELYAGKVLATNQDAKEVLIDYTRKSL